MSRFRSENKYTSSFLGSYRPVGSAFTRSAGQLRPRACALRRPAALATAVLMLLLLAAVPSANGARAVPARAAAPRALLAAGLAPLYAVSAAVGPAAPVEDVGRNSSSDVSSARGPDASGSPSQPPALPLRVRSYAYVSSGGRAAGNPLGMALSPPPPGFELSRWVIAAWALSNLTHAGDVLSGAALARVQGLLTNVSAVTPGALSLQLAGAANVTVGARARLAGASSGRGEMPAAAAAALGRAAATMAGGFDTAHVRVWAGAGPELGERPAQFMAAGAAPVSFVHRAAVVAGARARRLLGAAAGQSPGAGASAGTGDAGDVDVWLSFTGLEPQSAAPLLDALRAACGGAGAPGCAADMAAALREGGMPVQSATIAGPPMVSLAVRVAIGVTAAQAASGADAALAAWLAEPRNVRAAIDASGVPDPVGLDTRLRWLTPPQIWLAQPEQPTQADAPLAPGAVAGIAISAVAAAATTAAAGVWMVRRQLRLSKERKRHSSGDPERRQRRRQGKRRYLAPEQSAPGAPEASVTTAPGARGSSDGGSSPCGAAGGGAEQPLRPELRELGDSVTSAAHYEDDDGSGARGVTSEAASSSAGSADAEQRRVTGAAVLAARAALLEEAAGQRCARAPQPACGMAAAGVAGGAVKGSAAQAAAASAAPAASRGRRPRQSPFAAPGGYNFAPLGASPGRGWSDSAAAPQPRPLHAAGSPRGAASLGGLGSAVLLGSSLPSTELPQDAATPSAARWDAGLGGLATAVGTGGGASRALAPASASAVLLRPDGSVSSLPAPPRAGVHGGELAAWSSGASGGGGSRSMHAPAASVDSSQPASSGLQLSAAPSAPSAPGSVTSVASPGSAVPRRAARAGAVCDSRTAPFGGAAQPA